MAEWDDRVEGLTRDHGRIVSVSTQTLGTTLTADVAAGATVLPVFDVGHFDAKYGGTLNINGATLAYATCDDDTDTITLTDPLSAAALDGDFVACWDTLYDTASTVKTAMVQVDGDDDNPDPIECFVPHYLADKLADGDRGGPGEDCEIEYIEEDDEWRVADVRGLSDQAGQKFEADDFYTLTADDITAGTATFPLSHSPVQDSLTAWCGIPQPPTEFTIDYAAATITFPLAGFEEAGDEIWVHYAYRDTPTTPTIVLTVTVKAIYNVIRDSTNALVTVVGQPPWADDSDATYADLQAKYDTGVGTIGIGHTYLPAAPDIGSVASTAPVNLRVKIQALNGEALVLPNFSIQLPDGTDLMSGGGTGTTPTVPTWVTIPLSGAREADVLTALATDQGSRLHFAAPFIFSGTLHTWRIFEAQVVIG